MPNICQTVGTLTPTAATAATPSAGLAACLLHISSPFWFDLKHQSLHCNETFFVVFFPGVLARSVLRCWSSKAWRLKYRFKFQIWLWTSSLHYFSLILNVLMNEPFLSVAFDSTSPQWWLIDLKADKFKNNVQNSSGQSKQHERLEKTMHNDAHFKVVCVSSFPSV